MEAVRYMVMHRGVSHVFDRRWFDFNMEWEMRLWSTLSEFHERYIVEEGVDFCQ